jgi:small subunit ribosomal protein S6
MVILDPFLQDAEYPAQIDRIKELLAKHGGEVANVDAWGRKRMAYMIAKKQEGYYAVLSFEGKIEGPAINEIERQLRINDNVLRAMITRIPEPKPAKKVKPRKPRAANVEGYQGGDRRYYPEARSAGQAGAAALGHGEETNE